MECGEAGKAEEVGCRFIIRARRRVCCQAQCATHRDRTTARVNSTMDKTGQGGTKQSPSRSWPRSWSSHAYTIKRPPVCCETIRSYSSLPCIEERRNVEFLTTTGKCQKRVLRNITGLVRTSCTTLFPQRLLRHLNLPGGTRRQARR